MSGSSDPEGLPRNLHLHKGFLRQVFHESSLEKEPFELLAGKRSRKISRDFPGSPAVDWTLSFHCWGHEFDPWLGELRFHMLCGVAKKSIKFKKVKNVPKWGIKSWRREFWPLLFFHLAPGVSQTSISCAAPHWAPEAYFKILCKCTLNFQWHCWNQLTF